jgi:histidinol phosphatase-like enzyme
MESGGFGEPDKLPTEGEVILRLSRIADALNYPLNMYYCFAYKSKSSDEWGPAKSGEREWSHSWRKPGPGMLLQAMKDAGASPDETVFIGDSEEDRLAAEAAGVKFVHADVFFNAA